jgi:hypothetical protein
MRGVQKKINVEMGNNMCVNPPTSENVHHPEFPQASKLRLFKQLDLLRYSNHLAPDHLSVLDHQLVDLNLHDLDYVGSQGQAPLWY